MQLQWREIDPALAGRAWQHRRRAAEATAAPQKLGVGWSAFALTAAVLLVGLYATLFFHWMGPAGTIFLALCPAALFGVVLGPHWQSESPRGRLSADTLRFTLDYTETSRVERVYGETVLLLVDSGLPRRTARDVLREVNALAADDRQLVRQCARLSGSVDPTARARAVREREALAERLAAESDPIAQGALAESVALCEARIESLDALPQALRRLEAHRELICQALELSHASLLRARAAGLALTPPDTSALREQLGRLVAEARAVEEAAAELEAR